MVTPKKATELIRGSFSYDITESELTITPYNENGDYIEGGEFTIDLSKIDEETMAKLLVEVEY